MSLAYYSYDKIYSYNAAYNFICGGRGIGKTYGAKIKAIRAAIRDGSQFIYLRRYRNELTVSRNTFFADVAHVFPDWDFRINGSTAEMSKAKDREEKKRKWVTIGFFIALSTAQNQKSVAFPNVKLIIFDEFIIEKGAIHYLPQEPIVFNNFFSTVDRYKDKTKVLFLANSVSIMNPYFIEYEIIPKAANEIIKKHDGFMVVQVINSDEFNKGVYKTRFGKFIEGTEYAEYAVENQFSDNNDAMLRPKDPNARYIFTLETKHGTLSIWMNLFTADYYAQKRRPKDEKMYTLLSEKMDHDKTLITFTDRPLGNLRTAFRQGSISFDSPSTRNIFAEIFKR